LGGGIEDLLAGRKRLGEATTPSPGQVPQHDLLEVEPRIPAAPTFVLVGVTGIEPVTSAV
jgi:hypothetical protein